MNIQNNRKYRMHRKHTKTHSAVEGEFLCSQTTSVLEAMRIYHVFTSR